MARAAPVRRAPPRISDAALAAVAVMFITPALVIWCELVAWSGQPTTDWSTTAIHEWYGSHTSAVLAGDVVWILAMLGLYWAVIVQRPVGLLGRAAAALAFTATLMLIASALTAAALALTAVGISDDVAMTMWRLEGAFSTVGGVLLLVAVVGGTIATRDREAFILFVLAVPAVVLTLAGTGVWGFAATLCWFPVRGLLDNAPHGSG